MKIPEKFENIALFLLLALVWGSAFSLVKIALVSVTPLSMVAARVSLAAVVVGIWMLSLREKLPKSPKTWAFCTALGFTEFAAPLGLIAWGQKHVSASATAICMALIPLVTVIFAHFLTRDDKLSWTKAGGILLGFVGVTIMFQGGADTDGANSRLMQMAGVGAILLAVICYALSGILAVKLRQESPLASSAATLLTGVAMTLPVALVFDHPWTLEPNPAAIKAVVALALFPTAAAMILMTTLAARKGATYLSLSNYLVPAIGIALGVLWIGEKMTWMAAIGFFLICIGIYVSQHKPLKKK